MKILFATPEAAPYFRTGGLGEVARGLPDALAAAGHDVRILMPLYKDVARAGLQLQCDGAAEIPWPGGSIPVRFCAHTPDGHAPAILVQQPEHFETGDPYDITPVDPLATALRFAFFCRAAVHYARFWQPDVIHLNDWQCGLFPVYALLQDVDTPAVFAIHNLPYQGNFPPALLERADIPRELFRVENGVEFHGQVSFMKAGLALSDRLVTVSPTYAREIRTPEHGAGFHGLLRFRRRVLHGILNGIDTHAWHPALDRHIVAQYSAVNLAPKQKNRTALLEECRLEDGGPLFVMVTRLANQKGIDLVLDALPQLLEQGARLAVLGSGDSQYEKALSRAARKHRGRVWLHTGFDEALAHRLYAGGDLFLMPSRYEPCGLGQMIAQRYGTPPVVRSTGGLADTVVDGVTGFTFIEPSAEALVGAARRAGEKCGARGWLTLQRRCMRLDRSWARAAGEYLEVYRRAAG